MRAAPLFLFLSLAASTVLAQPASVNAPPTVPASEAATPTGPEQRTERIRVEDEGSRIDELRIGGQTQSITVTPKVSNLPAYEIQPSNDPQERNRSSSGTTGPRVWNMLKF